MTVILTSEALGKQPGASHTGPEEAWLLAEGYATKANYADDAPAVLVGATNAATIATGGDLVLASANKTYTVTLASSDTASAAATKIDTALSGVADAAIVSSKLNVTSVKTGTGTYLKVVSGTGTVLANLGLTAGQSVRGGDGGIGTSNTGLTATTPANDPTLASNREDAPALIDPAHPQGPYPAPGPLDPAMTFSTADDDPTDPDTDYDLDPGGVDNDPSAIATVTPSTGLAAGGTAVVVRGAGFERATSVTFGGVAGTAFSVIDDVEIHVTTPPHAAGAVSVVVVDADGNGTKASGFTYA